MCYIGTFFWKNIKGPDNDAVYVLSRLPWTKSYIIESNNTRETLAESYCVDKFDSEMLPLTCRLNNKYQFKDKELVGKINRTN